MSAQAIAGQIDSALKAVRGREKITDIYLVACGGSYAQMLPCQYALERESSNLSAHALNAAEFKARAPKRLGKNALAILCSHSGTTPETVEAAKIARAAGALTISLTHVAGSPLDEASEYSIGYVHEPMKLGIDHSGAVLARLVFGILAITDNNNKAVALDKGLAQLGILADQAISAHGQKMLDFAEAHKRESVIYTMASGASYGVAYAYAICILQEMQWIHSACIHAGEYFHGPFEVTDFDLPIIQLIGVGSSRVIDERAQKFAQKYTIRLTVLDAAELGADVLPESVAEYLVPLLFSTLLRAYADKLAEAKGHPLTVRRYMWKMEY